MLESMAAGDGTWKVVDTLGRPWIGLPEWMRTDLLTWRHLRSIAENRKKSMQAK